MIALLEIADTRTDLGDYARHIATEHNGPLLDQEATVEDERVSMCTGKRVDISSIPCRALVLTLG